MVSKIPLPPGQSRVLSALRRFIDERGYPPTRRELAGLLGIKSPNGITCHLAALERKGHLKCAPRAARGITLAS